MNISSPESIIFWTTLVFIILLILLRKYAWKPILNSVKKRETSINEALDSAEKARAEMENLKSDNEKMIKEAHQERDAILKEAHAIKENIIAEASEEAGEKASAMITNAEEAIESEKKAALADIKAQMSALSIAIAEKVVRQELENEDEQKRLVDNMLSEIELN